MCLEGDFVHVEAGEQVAAALASFHKDFAEVFVEGYALELGVGPEGDLDGFGLAVGVGGEVDDAASRRACGEVVLAVVGDAGHVEALDEAVARGAVAVDDVVDGAGVAALEDGDVDDLHLFAMLGLGAFGFANEDLVLHTGDFVGAVAVEDDDVVDG